jgi:hypothetical protein
MVDMKVFRQAALWGLLLAGLVACGSDSPNNPPPGTTGSSGTAQTTSAGPSETALKARATISLDGLEFVGADAAEVGDTIQVDVTNQESGSVHVSLLNPGGTAVSQVDVSGGGTGPITGTLDAAGDWTVAFKDEAGELTKKISVH